MLLEDLNELISIESVMDEAKANAPFGQSLRKALDWFLKKAASYGLKTGELDGYAGFAEYGEGDGLIGILGHLDVVPAGDGWHYPPFELTKKDGVLYGRGVVDNKGPIIVGLHILKELKEKNIKLKNRIRLIVGCNEENGSLCMKHYVKHGELPKMSIVPDADFPLINSEKGILHLIFKVPTNGFVADNFDFISSGERANVVPDFAEAVVKNGSPIYNKIKSLLANNMPLNDIFLIKEIKEKIEGFGHDLSGFFVEEIDDNFVVKTHGISGHAMSPELAENAAYKILSFLTALNGLSSGENTPSYFELFSNKRPSHVLNIDCSDEKSGSLTLNLGKLKYDKNLEDNSIEFVLDVRLPISANKQEILQKIKAVFPKNTDFELEYDSPNLYLDTSLPLIQTLLRVYENATNTKATPVQTGGGTYAKTLKNSVAFGPTFPKMVTNIHKADEAISEENFNRLYEIYKSAILELDKI